MFIGVCDSNYLALCCPSDCKSWWDIDIVLDEQKLWQNGFFWILGLGSYLDPLDSRELPNYLSCKTSIILQVMLLMLSLSFATSSVIFPHISNLIYKIDASLIIDRMNQLAISQLFVGSLLTYFGCWKHITLQQRSLYTSLFVLVSMICSMYLSEFERKYKSIVRWCK